MSFEQPQFVHDEIMPSMMFRYVRYLGQDFDVSGATPATSSQQQPSKPQQPSPQKQAQRKQQPQQKQASAPAAAPKSSPTTITVTTSFPPQPLPEIITHDEIMPAMMFKYVKYLQHEFHADITSQQPSLHFGVHHTPQQKQAAAQKQQPQVALKAQPAQKQSSQPAAAPQDLASIVLTELMAIRELLVQQQEIHNKLLAERSKLQETHDKLKYRANHLQKSIAAEKAKQSAQPKATPTPAPAKVEAKETKADTKVEANTQPKPETKTEANTQAKPEAKTEAKTNKTSSPVKQLAQPKTEPTPVPTPVTITAAVSTPAPATTTTTPTTTTTSTPTSRKSISVPELIEHHTKEIEKATPKVDVVSAGRKASAVSTPNPKGSPKGSPKKSPKKAKK